MKKHVNLLMAILIAVVISSALAVAFTGGTTTTCKGGNGNPEHYTIMIQNNHVSHPTLTAHKCDTMTITNKDSIEREIAFGFHDHHVAYDGVEERELHQGETLTITFVKTGTYHWHDHLHDEIESNFTVSD